LAGELSGLFTPVSPEGAPRSFSFVQEELEALLSLLEEIPSAKVQDLRKRLARQQKGLLGFWEDWERRLAELREAIPQEELLQALLLEYFLSRRKKPSGATQAALEKAQSFVETPLGQQTIPLREQVAETRKRIVIEITASGS